jgi:hypothetical protein
VTTLLRVGREYYSDRIRGPRARTAEEVSKPLWAALLALVERGLNSGLFAQDFPLLCEDGAGVYGSDRAGFMQTLRAEIPDLDWPLDEHSVPPTLAVLDLLEFLHHHASQATEGPYHSFYRHHHLSFDRRVGRGELRESVNRLLARNGTVYELDTDGAVTRLAAAALAEQLRHELPATRDDRLDDLLQAAITKYLDPDPGVRREALEQLWDAFERSKTVLDRDKKRGAAALIVAAAAGAPPEEAQLLRDEMKALTDIGNAFRIRHHETWAIEPTHPFVDHLFARMYALMVRLHPALR